MNLTKYRMLKERRAVSIFKEGNGVTVFIDCRDETSQLLARESCTFQLSEIRAMREEILEDFQNIDAFASDAEKVLSDSGTL